MSHQHFPKLILLSATIQKVYSAGSQCPLHQQSPHRMPAPRGLLNLATIVFVTGREESCMVKTCMLQLMINDTWMNMFMKCSWTNYGEDMDEHGWTCMDMDGHGWTCSWKNWVHQLRRQAEKSLLWRPVRAHPGPGPKRFRRPRGSRRRMMYPFITCRMQKWKLIRSWANLKCFNVEMPIPAVAYCSDVVAMAWFPDGILFNIAMDKHHF